MDAHWAIGRYRQGQYYTWHKGYVGQVCTGDSLDTVCMEILSGRISSILFLLIGKKLNFGPM